jgi:hypothetical protein
MAFKFPLSRTLLVGDPYYLLRRDAHKIPDRLRTLGRLHGIIPIVATDSLVESIRAPEVLSTRSHGHTDWLFGARKDFHEYVPMGSPWTVSEYLAVCTTSDLQRWHSCGRYQNMDSLLSDFRLAYGDEIEDHTSSACVQSFACSIPGFPFIFSTHRPGGLHCTVNAVMAEKGASSLHVRVSHSAGHGDVDILNSP